VKELASRGQRYQINGDYKGKGYRLSLQGKMKTPRQAVSQFRSFLGPLVILLTVPFGFIGVAAALTITSTALSPPRLHGRDYGGRHGR
jgi:hypothetical protein